MEKSVAIIGAGKIGRGYLADLFGDAGYHLVFINGSPTTIDKLNAQGYYTLFITDDKGTREKRIDDFEAYSSQREFDKVVERLSQVEQICVALYPGAYPSVADQLAATIKKRVEQGNDAPMNVFFFVNKVFTARTMKALIEQRLETSAQRDFFANRVGLVEALTHRGGTNPTPEMLQKDPLCISSSEGRIMPVGDNIVGERPNIVGMEFMDRIEGRLVRKVWCGNMRHCTQAAIGRARGYTYTVECANDQYVRKCVDYAAQEANFGVGAEFGFSEAEMNEGFRHTWRESMNSLSLDDVFRVAADPLRKLARDDRYIGPALLCLKHGKTPYFLARGAAYMLLFVNEKDESAVKLQQMIKDKGVEQVIWDVCGLDSGEKDEKILYDLILGHYLEILEHDAGPLD